MGAASVGIGLTTVPQAVASETCTSTTGARVCFETYGDHFFVYDTSEDGHRAAVKYYWDGSGGNYYCEKTDGAGGTPKDCNRDLPENVRVYFRADVCEGPCNREGAVVRTSAWDDALNVN
ncbi:hypothetical protein GCM10010431_40410 [Streptomyces kunmingensis]